MDYNRTSKALLGKEMSRKEFLAFSMLAIASIFGITGLLRELASHAGTPTASDEPETGSLTGGASLVSDSAASGGKAVAFHAVASNASGLSSSPPAYPTYTDYPIVQWASIYKSGRTFSDIMNNSYPSYRCYLELPSGFDEEIVDFTKSSYGVYTPNCMGIWGPGPDQARIKLRPSSMSSASISQVPTAQSAGGTNPLSLIRLGPNGSAAGYAIHCYGWTLEGTDQQTNPNTGLPYNYNGFTNYYPNGSTFQWLNLRAAGYGDWNSPPGETNAFNTLLGSGTVLEDVEIDGTNSNGIRRGAATASNGSSDVTYKNCYFHDSFVSGETFGGYGGPDGTMCKNVTTNGVKVYYNSNHPVPSGINSGGKTFSGVNHEGAYGTIFHQNMSIEFDSNSPQEHFFFGNTQASAKVTLQDISYVNGPTYAHGLLVVHCPDTYDSRTNSQRASDITVIKNGVALTPVAFNTTGDPAKNYMLYT